jgi:hypothetical protein
MSHISSCKLLADLALFARTSKIFSRLIVNYYQSQIFSETIPIAVVSSQKFLAQQGLYVSSFIHQIIHSNSYLTVKSSLEQLDFDCIENEYERTFVHIHFQSNSMDSSIENMSEWGDLLILQLTNSNLETDLIDWIIWTDDRGYLYFQPTIKALSIWLKMLFDRACAPEQNSEFSAIPDGATASNDLLHYIKLRCNQTRKLAEPQINPWIQGELNCTQTAELELIYGIIQVYDSLYMGANYKIATAGKSLAEKFLEFDRTCRLLDLDPNSPAFHERAGLIAIVRSAIGDLLANQTIVKPE